MTPTTWLLIVMAGWFALGAVEAMFLGRRGFDGFSWFLIGVVLGPLSLLLAWSSIRRDERLQPTVIAHGRSGEGGVDVLIGVDGSPESLAAITSVQAAFGPRLRRVALVSVLHFDDPPAHERAKVAELEQIGRSLALLHPDLLVVRGHPATALAEEARIGGYDLVAIGATGHGHAHVFGSAAKELVHRSPVPVLVAGQHVDAPTRSAAR